MSDRNNLNANWNLLEGFESDQDIMDSLLDLDGRDEFVIYIAPVGRR
jgi:hypothetical protein